MTIYNEELVLDTVDEIIINLTCNEVTLEKILAISDQMLELKKFKAEAKRNNPCPCGSGKKYKKCCLNK